MKKAFFVLNFIFILIGINAKSYRPYPIIFIHGVGATSQGCWGAGVDTLSDGQQLSDWVTSWESTYAQFLDLMQPYILADPDFFFQPTEDGYPNRDLLEIINFNDNRGSIDPHSGYLEPHIV
jgi:hypothetical protein